MRLPLRFLPLVGLGLALTLSACGDMLSPDEPEPQGLFDESPLLPALSAADAEDWQWVPTEGMRCRDGSDTGFGLRRGAGSPDLLILLQGGGSCSDPLSCRNNPKSLSEDDFYSEMALFGNAGIRSSRNTANPFLGWNTLYVPYCTGDHHSGSATGVQVPGVAGRQDFVGYRNIEALLERIASEAQDARRIVLAGVSAGGIGTVGTYGLFAERLAPAPVDLLNDSGPFLRPDAVLSPELQQRWRDLWNLEPALPDGCGALCSQPDGDGLEYVLPYYAQTHPDRTFGLLSFERDWVIRFWSGRVTGAAFEDGLYDLRRFYPENTATYFVPGAGHGFLQESKFYSTTVEGVPLARWVQALIDGQTTDLPTAQAKGLARAE